MIQVGLAEVLETLAERRREYPLHGDSLDWSARSVICKAVPPGERVPGPDDPTRPRMATGSPGLTEPNHDTARACYEKLYRTLCGEGS
jgi:hypothetical protein